MIAARALTAISERILGLEKALLVTALLVMLLLAVVEILLRNVLGFGLIWSDTLVRMLVLWVAMLGAMIASHRDRHIRIDVLVRLLPTAARPWIESLARLLTAVICALAAYYSIRFVSLEYQDGVKVFAEVPSWLCALIIPLAFIAMTVRYGILAWLSLPGRTATSAT